MRDSSGRACEHCQIRRSSAAFVFEPGCSGLRSVCHFSAPHSILDMSHFNSLKSVVRACTCRIRLNMAPTEIEAGDEQLLLRNSC
jgi:hypothetical protein